MEERVKSAHKPALESSKKLTKGGLGGSGRVTAMSNRSVHAVSRGTNRSQFKEASVNVITAPIQSFESIAPAQT